MNRTMRYQAILTICAVLPLGGCQQSLEPATEGRLAATLARHGEGWVATWFAAADDEDDAAAGAVSLSAGVDPFVEDDAFSRPMRSAVRAGPLGPERLLLDGPVTGPHRLVVRPATIEP